jgi:hypothetical protein
VKNEKGKKEQGAIGSEHRPKALTDEGISVERREGRRKRRKKCWKLEVGSWKTEAGRRKR